MTEVWFYHLERQPAAAVLPGLLVRGLERGLRMAIQTSSDEQVKNLSQALWAAGDTSFIAHGTQADPDPETQPIFIAASDSNANAASYRFFVDGALPQSVAGLARAMILFDGQDQAALDSARGLWRQMKAEGHAIKYWKQDDNGRWVDQAA